MVGATSERLRLRLQETKCGGGDGKERTMMAVMQREKKRKGGMFVLFCFGSGLFEMEMK